MKHRIITIAGLVFLATLLATTAEAQWVACAGGSPTCTTQFVGIGRTNPAFRLHLEGGGDEFAFSRPSFNTWLFGVGAANGLNGFHLTDSVSGRTVLSIEQGTTGLVFMRGNALVAGALSGTGDASFSGTVSGGNVVAKYQDVAEWVPATEPLDPGTVVVLNPEKSNEVMRASRSYDTTVAGVVSARPGLLLGEKAEGSEMIATTGRVLVRVDASRGAVRVGDLLVTSDKPGVAMRSEPVDVGTVKMHRPGTIIGKALEPLSSGEASILVLLSMQ